MAGMSARRVAEVSIAGLLLALLRCLGEYYRLRYLRGAEVALAELAAYITGALIAALGAGAAVVAYFAGRHRLATGIVAVAVATMLVYKVLAIGWM